MSINKATITWAVNGFHCAVEGVHNDTGVDYTEDLVYQANEDHPFEPGMALAVQEMVGELFDDYRRSKRAGGFEIEIHRNGWGVEE